MYMIICEYVIKSTKESHDLPILTRMIPYYLNISTAQNLFLAMENFLKPGLIKHCHKTLKIIYNNI